MRLAPTAVTTTVAVTIGEPLVEPMLQQMLEPVEDLDGMMLGPGWMLQALGAMLQPLQLPSRVADGKCSERSLEYRQAPSSRAVHEGLRRPMVPSNKASTLVRMVDV